jgi:hypothetical protein
MLDVIVEPLAHAWNSNSITGFVNHEDILVKMFVAAEQDHPVNSVGGIIIQSRFQYDIDIEFIPDICMFPPLLFQLLYIIIFQGT